MMKPARDYDFFVTGTDTEVGKTLAACALLHALRAGGLSAAGLKPVAAGAEWQDGAWRNEDVAQLRAASSLELSTAEVCPYILQAPAAPHLVALQAGVQLELPTMINAFAHLQTLAEAVVVEGVGGFCVPFNDSQNSADLARELGLPMILVVGMRLGCLNHALLTAEAIRARGLRLAGWIANEIFPGMVYRAENIASLKVRLNAPLLGCIPHLPVADAQVAASYLDLSELN